MVLISQFGPQRAGSTFVSACIGNKVIPPIAHAGVSRRAVSSSTKHTKFNVSAMRRQCHGQWHGQAFVGIRGVIGPTNYLEIKQTI